MLMKWYSIINLQKLEPMNITCRVLKLEIMMTFNWWTAVLTLKLEIMMTSNWWAAVCEIPNELCTAALTQNGMLSSRLYTALAIIRLTDSTGEYDRNFQHYSKWKASSKALCIGSGLISKHALVMISKIPSEMKSCKIIRSEKLLKWIESWNLKLETCINAY